GQTNVPAEIRFQQFRKRDDMREGLVFFRNAIGMRREHQHRNLSVSLAHGFQDLRKVFGILRLGKEQVGRGRIDLLSQTAVWRWFQKQSVVSVADKILFEQTGNEIVLHIKNRSHWNNT